MWTYTVLLKKKKLVASRVRQDNAWPTMKLGTFSNWQNWHCSAQQNILSLLTIVLHWHHLFLILFLFCCNYFLILWYAEAEIKVCFVFSALWPFKPMIKEGRFPKTTAMIGRVMSNWSIIKCHTDNAWLYCRQKKKKKRPHQLLKNVARSYFFADDGCTSLPSMRLINIYSGISAIL